jgi:hypothetical protein
MKEMDTINILPQPEPVLRVWATLKPEETINWSDAATVNKMAAEAVLGDDEFVVCQDESVHIVYFSDLQVKFSPAVIRLTNQRVFIDATCEASPARRSGSQRSRRSR